MRGVRNDPDQPLARTLAGQIRRDRVLIRLVERVAFGAAHRHAGQRFDPADDLRLPLLERPLRLQASLRRHRREDLASTVPCSGENPPTSFFTNRVIVRPNFRPAEIVSVTIRAGPAGRRATRGWQSLSNPGRCAVFGITSRPSWPSKRWQPAQLRAKIFGPCVNGSDRSNVTAPAVGIPVGERASIRTRSAVHCPA